ncbi:hypothetical protein STEG23_006934 [Scotinomys teguina]
MSLGPSAHVVTEVMDINIDPGFCRTMDPDMVPGSSLGPDVFMYPRGSTGYSDQHVPRGDMALGNQNGHRWQPRPPNISMVFVVTWVMDINIDAS